MDHFEHISALRLGLASPQQIRSWSHGEVSRAETLHYRSHQPVPDGLFCERIFGPTRDWSCACGAYRHRHLPGFVCPSCGVELAPASVRRERLGHIELASPVVHPWYLRDRTISLLLDLTPRQLSAVLAAQRCLVCAIDESARSRTLAPSDGADEDLLACLHVGMLLEEEQVQAVSRRFAHLVQIQTGAEAIRSCLAALDLAALADQLRQQIATGTAPDNASRRLQVVEAFRASGQQPAWMVLDCIPVLPPELRPLLVLDGGRMVSSDLNELYCRLLHRNTRLKHLQERQAPDILLKNERRLLQQACEALFDNAHSKHPFTTAHGQPLKSLTDLLAGKAGRFRRNLLGKRVDYSGRSVIVAGPTLRLHECGLPKEMACELFKPFLISKLLDHHLASSPRVARQMVERRDPLIWDLLAQVLFERPVLLNRAPTLHRLSIQAFVPRLIEGQAIQLHPLVCAAFNADFDGDQMAVHVPLSLAAQQEATRLLLSTHQLRHPASGEPVFTPSQEIVLGCFLLTEERAGNEQKRRVFADANEALLAHASGQLDLHTPILVRLPDDACVYDAPPPTQARMPVRGRVETTVGRLLFNDVLPPVLRYRNYPMTKEQLKALLADALTHCTETETVQLLDQMKRLGYHYATRSGLSLALSDITIPREREVLIAQGHQREAEIMDSYHAGEMSERERNQQMITLWTELTEQVSATLHEALDPYGPIMTLVKSGATKAKVQQIRQLCGIRGLLASPSGEILPIPVLSNYKLGLLVWEIFIAASGARKGFMDRSLNTALSGYLTRRLVEAGMEALISEPDCQTREGLLIIGEIGSEEGVSAWRSRLIGRVLAEPAGGLATGTMLDESLVEALVCQGVTTVRVRSPLCCQAPSGICRLCYGSDLATGTLVKLHTAVGIIAGQAIGEPGTQLTMRTFHAGGIAHNASDITLGLPRVNDLFEGRPLPQAALLADREGRVIRIERGPAGAGSRVHVLVSTQEGPQEHRYQIPARCTVAVQEGQVIQVGTPLTEGPRDPQTVLSLLGREAAAQALIEEVQRVYRGAGARIHDKHLEVLVRQLLRFVQVDEAGDTTLIASTILDRFVFEHEVAAVLAQGGRPPRARPLLLGVTKTALQTSSWIAAASFQDMSRVLARAAIRAQQDPLRGLKERLVVGKRLPGS